MIEGSQPHQKSLDHPLPPHLPDPHVFMTQSPPSPLVREVAAALCTALSQQMYASNNML
jgi:hypothetical protein